MRGALDRYPFICQRQHVRQSVPKLDGSGSLFAIVMIGKQLVEL